MNKTVALAATLIGFAVAPAQAGSLTGIWQTEPDRKDQVGHVQITPCGQTLCGTVISAYDSSGNPVTTPNVGRRILWDVAAQGATGNGTVYVPIIGSSFPVTLQATGSRLNLRACNSIGLCKTQAWTRVE
ncbi:DUF2147 domain-containing protein [Pseudoruegeria sp. HB172150]|uniref:DUF2147 domain-containing protein n=1 Tax=Pseudoruegeria sp. HB172150 TaxID=2721164 RepID=UPI001557BDA6|nr:DUF2147 domain-containing protein [Pseudoruegeria sp. HB172150]